MGNITIIGNIKGLRCPARIVTWIESKGGEVRVYGSWDSNRIPNESFLIAFPASKALEMGPALVQAFPEYFAAAKGV